MNKIYEIANKFLLEDNEVLKEEIYIDVIDMFNSGLKLLKNVPICLNPSRDEFYKLAKHPLSTYEVYSHNDHGLRMFILNFDNKIPDILVWPAGITHYSMSVFLQGKGKYLKLDKLYFPTIMRLIWDSADPYVLTTEENLLANLDYSESDLEKIRNAVNRLPFEVEKIITNYRGTGKYNGAILLKDNIKVGSTVKCIVKDRTSYIDFGDIGVVLKIDKNELKVKWNKKTPEENNPETWVFRDYVELVKDMDLSEPEYATTIRKYHTMEESNKVKK